MAPGRKKGLTVTASADAYTLGRMLAEFVTDGCVPSDIRPRVVVAFNAGRARRVQSSCCARD